MHSDVAAAHALRGLGLLACRQGDLTLAEERLRGNPAMHDRIADQKSKAEGLEALAELRVRQQQPEEAVALYAAADGIREAIGAPLPAGDRPRYTRELTSLRVAVGPERFAVLWEEARRDGIIESLWTELEPAL